MTPVRVHDLGFPTATEGLAACGPTEIVELRDGDTYELRIAPVANQLDDNHVRMLAYNGSIPGPTLRVRRGSELTVVVRNDGDHETTVHWHGLRLDNQYDGVPDQTQDPIPVGGDFTYRLTFPDDGLYWYHPHVREDYGLEMGLYGNILVDPADDDAWPPASREAIVTLDDVLVEDARIAPFRTDGPTHTAMGRFGNVMLTGGSTNLSLHARVGEVVRLFLTNTANTRIFNLMIPGARIKLIGGDSGRYEREAWVDSVLLAPSERAIVDVRFDRPGVVPLQHTTPERAYQLGTVAVTGEPEHDRAIPEFETLHENAALIDERARVDEERRRQPDKTLVFQATMSMHHDAGHAAPSAWTCPMHPDVISAEPGACPHCGMRLIPTDAAVTPSSTSMTDHVGGHVHDSSDGLEWEDSMPEMNAATDSSNMIWRLVDAGTGHENRDIDWSFRVGDRVKIRLINTMDSDHPMHHPFHIHGAGRFLVLSREDVPEPNLVWKDTVLVRAGETVDILADVTSPGLWMAHCHIAEHHQDGMMFSFRVSSS